MDTWCRRHAIGEYDAGGDWAATGEVIPQVLREMQADDYFRREPAESAGLEHFNGDWLVRHLASHARAKPEDVAATTLR